MIINHIIYFGLGLLTGLTIMGLVFVNYLDKLHKKEWFQKEFGPLKKHYKDSTLTVGKRLNEKPELFKTLNGEVCSLVQPNIGQNPLDDISRY